MGLHYLIDRFADAGLPLELASAPFTRGLNAEHIFQMDIRRRNRRDARSEFYVAWPGTDNLVVVQGVDESEKQLVLMVREPSREFYVAVPQWTFNRASKQRDVRAALAKEANVDESDIFISGGGASVRRETPGQKRHFLAGRDERQLFMCRLPRACTTVRQAHEALRAPQVKESRSAIERAIRQGEWFFLALSEVELDELGHAIEGHRAWVRRKVSIGSVIPRAGKPHVAEELVVHSNEAGERRVYVRGSVRHADHKTIYLHEWRQVVRNREVDEARSLFGGTWID
jgi:hypothetical protein